MASRKLALKRLKETCGRHLTDAGWFCLMEAGASELYCAAAVPAEDSAPGKGVDYSARLVLERLVQTTLPAVGLHAFLGASYLPKTGGAAPFVAARDALALARLDTPFVLLAPDGADAAGVDINRHGSGTVERALEYMHAHLAENLSLSDVASAVGSAPSHLSRLFSSQGGDTFVHVFCRLRISTAKDLLRGGQYRVKEVCSMVGFNDQAYFSRVFRKYEGVSPADYRAG
jgi:AraC-like DNA-binding protein